MHPDRDISDPTMARQHAFGRCPGAYRNRGDCRRYHPTTPTTTVEC